jgi:uncharacterized membrane protein
MFLENYRSETTVALIVIILSCLVMKYQFSKYKKIISNLEEENQKNIEALKQVSKNADDFNTRLEIILIKLERIYQDNEQQKLIKEIISELKRELAKGQ